MEKVTHFFIDECPKELLDDNGKYKDTWKFIGIYPFSHGYTLNLIQVF